MCHENGKKNFFSRFRGKTYDCFHQTELIKLKKRYKKIKDSLINFSKYLTLGDLACLNIEKGAILMDHYGMVGIKNSLSERGIRDFGSNRDCLQTYKRKS